MKYLLLLITIGLSACSSGQDSTDIKFSFATKSMDSLIGSAFAQEIVKLMPRYNPDKKYYAFGEGLVRLTPAQDLEARSYYDSVAYFKDIDSDSYDLLMPIGTDTTRYPYIKAFYKQGLLRKIEAFLSEKEDVFEHFALPAAIGGIVWGRLIRLRGDDERTIEYRYKNTTQNIEIEMKKGDEEDDYTTQDIRITRLYKDSSTHKKYIELAKNNKVLPIKTKADFAKLDRILECENTQKVFKQPNALSLWKKLKMKSANSRFCLRENDKWKCTYCWHTYKNGKLETFNEDEILEDYPAYIPFDKKGFWDSISKYYTWPGDFRMCAYLKPEKGSEYEEEQLAQLLDIYSRVVDKKTLEELRIMVLQD